MANEEKKKKSEKQNENFTLSSVLNAEFLQRILYILLLLWVLLPVFSGGGFIFYELTSPENPQYVYQAYLAARAPLNFYGRMFFILGTVTAFADILYLCAVPRTFDWMKRAARLEPWHVLLLFILLWAVICTLLSDSPLPQFLGSEYQYDGLFSYFLFASVYVCSFLYSNEAGRMRILRVLTSVANFCSVIMLGQAFQWPFIRDAFLADHTSVFFNRNHFAYYLCVSVVCAAGLYLYDRGLKRGIWYLLSLSLQSYTLLINDTFGSYLAVLLALPVILVFYARSGRRFTPALTLPVVLFLLVNVLVYTETLPYAGGWRESLDNIVAAAVPSSAGGDTGAAETGTEAVQPAGAPDISTGRFRIWPKAVRLILQRPVFGFGPDGMPADYDSRVNRPHNEFLQIGVFLGVPAMLAYLAALFLLAWRQWNHLAGLSLSTLIAAGGTVTYLISAFFGVPMFYTMPYLFLCLGMTGGREKGNPLEEPPQPAAAWEKTFENRLILWTSGALILCLMVFMMLSRYGERKRETIDTTNMNLAAMQASSAMNDGVQGSFWYDPEEGGLLPVTGNEVTIRPYGRGTSLKGAYYIDRHLNGLPYNEASDYRGCILQVTLDRETYGDSIVLDWIPVQNAGE